ncbi:MAG: hypothetical protein OEW05_14505 [Candidatus Aminicenantes bacterium]|nr:hypothetical protein [Candidatus Aminicenantes bacterium]
MSRAVKIILVFLLVDAVAVGIYFGVKSLGRGSGPSAADTYEWQTIDAAYTPQDTIEAFIKDDAEKKGAFPVSLRNFGRNEDVLKQFQGSEFARPKAAVLSMLFPGLDDWKLVELRYTGEKGREVRQTILYVMVNGTWRVADRGQLLK